MTSDDRMTSGLIADVLGALERHGYHRSDDQHTILALGMIIDLADVYQGSLDASYGTDLQGAPPGQHAEPGPSGPDADAGVVLTRAEVSTVFAALQIAADDQRDRAEMCVDCPDQTCTTCQTRLRNAQAYEQMADELLQTADAARTASSYQPEPGGPADPSAQPHPAADKEAGQ